VVTAFPSRGGIHSDRYRSCGIRFQDLWID
jgi:hypothetical protein